MKTTRIRKQRIKTARLVKAIRVELRMTQQKLADAIGKQRCDIARYEGATVVPPGDVLMDIIKLYTPFIGDLDIRI